MARRKRKTVQGKLYTQQKTVTTIDKTSLRLHIQWKKFPKSIYLKPGMNPEEIEKIIDKSVRPEFEKFFKKTKGKRRGDKYILTMMTNMNFSGKRVKTGFSTKRIKITKLEHFERAMQDLKHGSIKGFMKKILQYLARAGLTSYSIRGVKMEVAKPNEKRKRKTKKTKAKPRSSRRPKR